MGDDLVLTQRAPVPGADPEPEFWPTLAAVAYLDAHDLAHAAEDGPEAA